MWCYRLVAPYTFERTDVAEPSPESPRRRPGAAAASWPPGICGSDLPGFRGTKGKLPGDTGPCAAEMDGFPIHEIVGEVLASRHPGHRIGDRVVGWASGFDGLMAQVVADGNGLVAYDPALSPHLAVGLQPLACVLYAARADRRTSTGKQVAIIGQGSIGLLFAYAAKALGAAHVTGVDPVDRSAHGRGVRRGHRGAGHQRPLGQQPGPEGQARHRHRGGRPSGRHAAACGRGGGVRRHRLLLRRA